MPHVLTFGEIMLRLSTPGFQRFGQTAGFEARFGGAEANVAVAVAQLGGSAGFVTKLPDHEIAECALQQLRGLGVDVCRVLRGGERIGIYFLEHGTGQRPGKVIYDRAHSAIATANPDEFHWDQILNGASWFHVSGITPALSEVAAESVRRACATARQLGLTVSLDVNHRSKLWTFERAGAILSDIVRQAHLCVASLEELRAVFGIEPGATGVEKESTAAFRLCERFGVESVAVTMRDAVSAGTSNWGAMLYHRGAFCFSRRYEVEIVDRLGAGDSFTGALIFALGRGDSSQKAIDFAVAASALKHTVCGDYNLVTLAEVEALAAGANSGRIQR